MNGIEIKINSVSLESLIDFYNENDNCFNPPLNAQVDSIEGYARKLKNNAILFEAWDNEKLTGLVAAYFNNYENKIGFITSVIVSLKYQNKGIAKTLLKNAIDFARDKGFEKIQLEVYKENESVISLYKKTGFAEKEQKMIQMELDLKEI